MKLLAHTQNEPDALEPGGVLLGRWPADGQSFVVDGVWAGNRDEHRLTQLQRLIFRRDLTANV